jgi:hypothetical protein
VVRPGRRDICISGVLLFSRHHRSSTCYFPSMTTTPKNERGLLSDYRMPERMKH